MSYAGTHYKSLGEAALDARNWLFEAAAPLWSAANTGDAMPFPELLSLAGEKVSCPHRLRVQARHVFSFCELGRLGWNGPWREAVERGVNFLLKSGRRGDSFFIHGFDATGRVTDARADLYDQAFCLLALAHAAQATGRSDLMEAAESLDDALEERWRLANGCYHEGEVVPSPPHRQNPHMHLLESFLALHRLAAAPRWRKRAERMAHLCTAHFIDWTSGALREYFDAELRPMPGETGRIVEPGHCFEWTWLFECLAQSGVVPDAVAASDGLAAFARRFGLDETRGVAINAVLIDGTVHDASARLWPQTERLKAALARFRRTGEDRERDEALAAYAGLIRYFEVPKRGVWRDRLMADGSWVEEPAPGSSFYHIVCALAELIDTAESG